MYNDLIINSMYCNVSVRPVRRTVIVLACGPTRRVHTIMLYAILILRARTNWRQGRLTSLANNAPSYLHYKIIIIKIVHLILMSLPMCQSLPAVVPILPSP